MIDVRPFQPHHYAWIMTHQCRSMEWLRQMLSEGFHIHHMDGDHDNNATNNLILIEGADHFRLHGGDLPYIGRVKLKKKQFPLTEPQLTNRYLAKTSKKEAKQLERDAAYRIKLDEIIEARLAKEGAKRLARAQNEELEWTY